MHAAKLILVKKLINRFTLTLLERVPDVGPKRPVSWLTHRLFRLLQRALTLHPERFYANKNFPRVLGAVERVLIFIAEEDGHYAGWLTEAMLLIHDLVEESRRHFPPGQEGDVAWYRWAAQHRTGKVSSKTP